MNLKNNGTGEQAVRIGTRIRHARLTRGLTLQGVAAEIGCSVSTLSKIENLKANPSITMLHKICGALGINMGSMFADEDEAGTIVSRADSRPVLTTDQLRKGHGIQLQRLVPAGRGYLLQGNVHIIEPGGYSNEALQHEGEEVGYVLEGTLELVVDGKIYTATAGDSFFFRSGLEHSYRNPGRTLTRVVWVNTPPTF